MPLLPQLQFICPLTQVTVLKCMTGQHWIKIMNQVHLLSMGQENSGCSKAKSTFGIAYATMKFPVELVGRQRWVEQS